MDVLSKGTPPHVYNKLEVSFDAVRWLYVSVIIVYPIVGYLYPLILEAPNDPLWVRIVIGLAVSVVYVLAHKIDYVRSKISMFSLVLYYVISAHGLYLIYTNDLHSAYVMGIIIIIGIGHVIFYNFRQITLFLVFLLVACVLVISQVEEAKVNPTIFSISMVIIGFFAFISLKIRFNLSRRLLVSSFIVDNVNEGILIVSMDDRVHYANSKIRDIIGYTEKELLGKDIKDYLATNDDRQVVIGKTDVRLKGISDKYELNFRHKDGHTVLAEVSGTPTYNDNGVANGSISVITDITERKQSEEELKKLSLVASKTDNYVMITNEDDEIAWANEGFEKTTGYSLDEVKGKIPKSFLHGPETDPRVVRGISEKMATGNSFYEEIKNYTKKGKLVWLSLNVTPLKNDQGDVTGYITIGNDITTKKTAEENLKQNAFRSDVIRQIDQAIIGSETLPILAKNTVDHMIKLLPGCSNASLVLKNDESEVYEELASVNESITYKRLPSKIQDILDAGYPYLVGNLKNVRRPMNLEKNLLDNNINAYVFIPLIYGRELLGSLNIFWDRKKPKIAEDVEMLEGVARDLALSIRQFSLQTALSARNRELKSNLRELKATHEELQSFSYIVSHDLKAPLRAISSLTNWLITDYSDKMDEQGKDYLDLLLGRTKRMHNLIEGILKYSRIGRMNMQVETISSREVLLNIIDLLALQENVEFIIDDNMPVVHYNSIQLQQVFQNLVSNSIKFMNKDKGIIQVGVLEKEGMYEFFVKDNGPGIDKVNYEKIFKIFQTLSSKDEVDSTGIGLTIVKKIIELNGGEIWLESELGESTTVYFTIPKRKNPLMTTGKPIKENRHE